MPLPTAVDRDNRQLDEPPKVFEFRTAGQRDRDRILHSSAFRRLAGVTQVVSAAEDSQLLHNRLTHSIKVAQVARRLAERLNREETEEAKQLGGIDPDVVEAAALAHDLGHPPFGHVGEKALDEAAKGHGLSDAFEGNAQSFRIVTKIAIRTTAYPGLNLSRATLNALLKYPWTRGSGGTKQEKKWSVYHTENSEFVFAREGWQAGDTRKCVEAEIMDWADDIAYSVHDVEDFYRMGLIPLDKLARDKSEQKRFFDRVHTRHIQKKIETGFSRSDLEKAFRSVIDLFPEAEYEVSTHSRATLRSFTSQMIAQYVAAFHLRVPSTDAETFIRIDDQALKEVTMLKELTWNYVIHNPALATQQRGYRHVVKVLFDELFNAAKAGELNIFPPLFRDAFDKTAKDLVSGPETDKDRANARIVLDVISSMTEKQALRMYGRLRGTDPGSVLDPLYY